MFAVGASYLSLLQIVAAKCGLPYASVVFEVAGDGSPAYGVEVDVPCAGAVMACRSFFFWAPPREFSGQGYEQAALQAIAFLQRLYGFFVVDYSFQGVVLYSRIARDAVSVAATATEILSRIARERQALSSIQGISFWNAKYSVFFVC
jgi:hypothetical protein